ncbi:dihydrodipicolinate reductase [Marinactinospora thermotolerans]|uniref:NAD(P)H-dependent amine dehydrogenase family protein n=1 Tax=Marinactinospora thermotolerans TaxID=531310 RepID=UPI003D8A8691
MPIRVIQWATGSVGRAALRALLGRPEFELVGVYVHSPEKAGIDAGELAGLGPVGVRATHDPEEILALDADCVTHTPLPSAFFSEDPDDDARTICALLRSGKNVVTTTGFVNPRVYGPELPARLEAACAAGGASLHGTGVNPGFLSQVLPLALSGLGMRIDHIYLRECSDFAGNPSADVVSGLMGLGRSPDSHARTVRPFRSFHERSFAESMHLVAEGLGLELDDVESRGEVVVADRDFEVAAGTVRAGTVAGALWTFSGTIAGRPVIDVEWACKSDARRVPQWGRPGVVLRVEGVPDYVVRIEDFNHGLAGVAAYAVNAIPAVCAARPGIRTCLDLPLITGRGTVRLG